MSKITVHIPSPLRGDVGGAEQVQLQADTVGGALEALGAAHPGILNRLLTPENEVRPFVNLFLGENNILALQGLETPLKDGDVLTIIPAVAGGSGKDCRLQSLKRSIPEITPAEALALQAKGAVLIDVRESEEIAQGSPAGAYRLGRGYLELRVEQSVPDFNCTVLTLCGSGTRSLFAAESLKQLGYGDVRSIAGGFNRWKDEGLPFEVPQILDGAARSRYSRHLLMPEIGEKGQQKLMASKVLLVGAGGLGSPASLYLAAAGVGTLGLVDHDVVDRSNLQRQVLHRDDRVGMSKVASARQTLAALNPTIRINEYESRLESRNVEEIFRDYEVVIDGSDNFPTRYLVNDACVKLGLPNVYGAVYRFEGQVSVFWPARSGPCYRCLYPEPPPPELAPSCAEAGVLGVLPGVIGLLQAVETLKILLNLGEPLMGRMLYYDALKACFSELKLERRPHCAYCSEGAVFPGYVNYDQTCSTANVSLKSS